MGKRNRTTTKTIPRIQQPKRIHETSQHRKTTRTRKRKKTKRKTRRLTTYSQTISKNAD